MSRSTSEPRVNPSQDSRNIEVEGDLGTLDSVGGSGRLASEIEVDRIQDLGTRQKGVPMVEIRVNEDIENMSFVHAGRKESYSFKVGNRYRVPAYIAHELEAIGKLWH